MKHLIAGLALSCLPVLAAESAYGPRIYIHTDTEDGFDSYISAAIVKKHVPATITQDPANADYVINSSVKAIPESTGGKIARCLFLYCAGANGDQTATVQMLNAKTKEVVWAYNVHKGNAKAYQSTSESIAKHLKQFLESRR